MDRFKDILLNYNDFVIETKILTSGGYGNVHKAKRISDGTEFALKFFGYSQKEPDSTFIMNVEVDILMRLRGCSGFVQLEGVFEDTEEGLLPSKKYCHIYPGINTTLLTSLKYIYLLIIISLVIAMELLDFDLLPFLSNKGRDKFHTYGGATADSDTAVQIIFRDLVIALSYLHSKRLIHR
jgi:serine/threonine protein kinase